MNDLRVRTGSGQPFLAMFVLEPEQAQVIASTNPADEGKFRETLPYFIQGKHGPYFQNVYYCHGSAGAGHDRLCAHARRGWALAGCAGRAAEPAGNECDHHQRTGLHQTDDAFLVNTSNLFVTQPRLLPDPAVLQRGIHTEAVNAVPDPQQRRDFHSGLPRHSGHHRLPLAA